ncbi:MAG: tetratricopeptide repeat protein [Nitrospinae bacterium]|nr:tetratricopeptide repeat protein [Nitrospinota bacterium]
MKYNQALSANGGSRHSNIVTFALTAVLSATLAFCVTANAETIKVVKESSYTATRLDDQGTSRIHAMYQGRRLLVQEVADKIQPMLKDGGAAFGKTPEEAKEEILNLTAGAIVADVTDDKWDETAYYVKMTAVVDFKEAAESVEKFRLNGERKRVLDDLRVREDAVAKKIDRLLAKNKKEIKPDYMAQMEILSSLEWFARGMGFLGKKNFDQAAFAFDFTTKRDPDNMNGWEMQGWALFELGYYAKAIGKFETVLKLNPKFAKAYEGIGFSWGELGDLNQQVDNLRIAAKLGDKRAQDFLNEKTLTW